MSGSWSDMRANRPVKSDSKPLGLLTKTVLQLLGQLLQVVHLLNNNSSKPRQVKIRQPCSKICKTQTNKLHRCSRCNSSRWWWCNSNSKWWWWMLSNTSSSHKWWWCSSLKWCNTTIRCKATSNNLTWWCSRIWWCSNSQWCNSNPWCKASSQTWWWWVSLKCSSSNSNSSQIRCESHFL